MFDFFLFRAPLPESDGHPSPWLRYPTRMKCHEKQTRDSNDNGQRFVKGWEGIVNNPC